MRASALLLVSTLACICAPAKADDLYQGESWASISADHKAMAVGDALTVLVYQEAEASKLAQNSSRKKTDVGGSISVGSIDESADLDFGGGYSGRGEVRRSQRLVAQITVSVEDRLPNGDLVVSGEQWLRVNGETTRIGVRGRVRRADISSHNTILSSRIAQAEINYDGRGFVSRSANPGVINRIFSFLGLG
jgi:flagellar L-ring protein precursor FlgH